MPGAVLEKKILGRGQGKKLTTFFSHRTQKAANRGQNNQINHITCFRTAVFEPFFFQEYILMMMMMMKAKI